MRAASVWRAWSWHFILQAIWVVRVAEVAALAAGIAVYTLVGTKVNMVIRILLISMITLIILMIFP